MAAIGVASAPIIFQRYPAVSILAGCIDRALPPVTEFSDLNLPALWLHPSATK